MPSWTHELVICSFAVCNVLRVFAYVPQIICVLRDREGAGAVSMSTWSMLTIANLSTVFYAAVVLHDLSITLVFAANTTCCAAIVAATSFQRWRERTPLIAIGNQHS
jgi:uncharacterized protein with PQ loop repeat